MMQGVVHSQMSQWGNQIGSQFCPVIFNEHGMNTEGNYESANGVSQSYGSSVLYNETETGTYDSRPICESLESETMNAAWPWDPFGEGSSSDNFANGQGGAGNNWVGGYGTDRTVSFQINHDVTSTAAPMFSDGSWPNSTNELSLTSSSCSLPSSSSIHQNSSTFEPYIDEPNGFESTYDPANFCDEALHGQNDCLHDPSSAPLPTDTHGARVEIITTKIKRSEHGFNCMYCKRVFERKFDLILHVRKHTGYKPLKCGYCLNAYAYPSSLTRHMRDDHLEGRFSADSETPPASSSSVSPSWTPIQPNSSILEPCIDEPSGFESSRDTANLRDGASHSQNDVIHTPASALPTNDSHGAWMETMAINLEKSERGYDCMYCGKVYSLKPRFVLHVRKHTGYKPHKCKYCDEAFADPTGFRKHMKLHEQVWETSHDRSTDYLWDEAFHSENAFPNVQQPASFGTDSTALQIERISSDLGTSKHGYSCIHCRKVYSNNHDLEIHLRTHTGYKSLKCPYCPMYFGDPSHVSMHIKIHGRSS